MLRSLGGTARAHQLTTRCGRRALQASLADGRVVRVARGRYALPDADAGTVAALAAPGVLAGMSAALAYGWPPLHRPAGLEVAVVPGQRVQPRPGVRYRRRRLDQAERAAGRTGPCRTVLDCAASASFVDALAVADAALRSGQVLPEELVGAAEACRGHGAARVRQVARHADARAANAFESGLRGHLIQARFTGFVPQHVITGPGLLVCVDLADPERRIAVEADGFSVHGGRRSFARDLQRHDELAALGWVTLRFAWEHVMFRPEWVVDQVRSVRRRRRRTDRLPRTGSGRTRAT